MKRTILILLITLSCASPLLAQASKDSKAPKCALPVERAPELRGLRLGAPQSGVLARFPGTSMEKADKFGVSQLRLTIIDTSAFSKTLPTREKAVQTDATSARGEESAFIVDSAKFPSLKGVRRVRARFVDGRLAYLQVAYDDSIKWNSIDEFVESVSKTLDLPGTWSAAADSDGTSRIKELRCDGFLLTGDVGGDSVDTRIAAQLTVEDLAALNVVQKRLNELKNRAERDDDEKRKNFKP